MWENSTSASNRTLVIQFIVEFSELHRGILNYLLWYMEKTNVGWTCKSNQVQKVRMLYWFDSFNMRVMWVISAHFCSSLYLSGRDWSFLPIVVGVLLYRTEFQRSGITVRFPTCSFVTEWQCHVELTCRKHVVICNVAHTVCVPVDYIRHCFKLDCHLEGWYLLFI